MAKGKTLSLKERRFIDAYLGSANGNGTEAVLAAGYQQSRKVAGVTSAQLLAKPRIRQEVERRQAARTAVAILTADERDVILSRLASLSKLNAKDRIAAIKELNKCTGRHSMKHLHDGKLTLEEVLSDSRK